MNRITTPLDWIVLGWFTLAAVSGAIGGCAAAAIVSTHSKALKFYQTMAYTVIGTAAGLAVLFFGPFVGHVSSTEQLLRESFVAGVTVPILVAAQNMFSRVVLRYLGVEVQITLRKGHENRRIADEPELEEKK